MTTYTFEIHFTKNGKLDFLSVRARNKIDACREASKQMGDISIVDVSRVGN